MCNLRHKNININTNIYFQKKKLENNTVNKIIVTDNTVTAVIKN